MANGPLDMWLIAENENISTLITMFIISKIYGFLYKRT